MAEQIQKKVKAHDSAKKPAEQAMDTSRPDTSATEARIDKAIKNIPITFGAETQELPLSGARVQDVRNSLESLLSIPSDAQARVNGVLVDGNYVLQDTDALEFIKVSGQKG